MTNLNNVEPWLAQDKPVAAQFPTSLGLTSYNLFLVNHRMKIIHQSAQHANTIMRTSKQQMKPLLPSTNWIQNWMTDLSATVCMKRLDDHWRKREEEEAIAMILFSVFTLSGDPWRPGHQTEYPLGMASDSAIIECPDRFFVSTDHWRLPPSGFIMSYCLI